MALLVGVKQLAAVLNPPIGHDRPDCEEKQDPGYSDEWHQDEKLHPRGLG